MIDKLLSCEGNKATAELTVRTDNIFLTKNGLSPSGIIESMAQTAAARTGFIMKTESGSENKRVPIGVIGSIKNFKSYFMPQVGSKMIITIGIDHEVLNATIMKCYAEVNGIKAAEGNLQIFLSEEKPGKE
jgi:hypothetical protein